MRPKWLMKTQTTSIKANKVAPINRTYKKRLKVYALQHLDWERETWAHDVGLGCARMLQLRF